MGYFFDPDTQQMVREPEDNLDDIELYECDEDCDCPEVDDE